MRKKSIPINNFSVDQGSTLFDALDLDGNEFIEDTVLTRSVKEWNRMGFQVVHPPENEDESINCNVQYELV